MTKKNTDKKPSLFDAFFDFLVGMETRDVNIKTQEIKDASRESLKRISDVSGAVIRMTIMWFIAFKLRDRFVEWKDVFPQNILAFFLAAFFFVLAVFIMMRVAWFIGLHLLPNTIEDPWELHKWKKKREGRNIFSRAFDKFAEIIFLSTAAIFTISVVLYLAFFGHKLFS